MMSDVFFMVLGACIGSFGSVLVDRLSVGRYPTGRSICDFCSKQIIARDLIPFFSWLFLRGKSRCCRKPLSYMYPLIEVTMAAVYVLLGRYVMFSGQIQNVYQGIAIFIILSACVVIVFADLKYHIIPDLMSGMILVAGILYVKPTDLLSHIGAGLLLMSTLYLIHILTRGKGMGLGDVKFAFVIGMLLGLYSGAMAIYLAFILGGLYGVLAIVFRRRHVKSMIAFGPFLVAGMVTMMFFETHVWGFFMRYVFNPH